MPTRGFQSGGRVSHYDPLINPTHVNPGLWADCPLLEYLHDPSIGFLLDENFAEYDAEATNGEYVLTQATAGSAAISTTVPGALAIAAGSTTTAQGANVQHVKSTFIPAAGKDLWAEFRVHFTGVGNLNVETFIGLAEVDTTVIASAAVSTDNHIGFSSVTDDGILLFNTEKATAGATTAAHTIVSAAVVKLGFKITGVTSAQMFVNGVATGTAHATANIPIVRLVPTLVCHSGGTDSPVLVVEGYRIFQLR
jgi:hypothetical protein